jgi:tetratricopeptide (TPR) repeat protein
MSLPQDQTATPEEVIYHEAVSAIRGGERARARDLLTRLLKTGQENAAYWVWMSAVVDTPKERLYCLKEALRIDPHNAAARRGLVISGALPPQADQVVPPRYQRREWQTALAQPERPARPAPPAYLIGLMAVALLVIVGLVGFALFGEQLPFRKKRRLVIVIPTYTAVAGAVVTLETPTPPPPPDSGSPTPLWMLLEATYTPTPLYVGTPHMGSEAFGLGVRALQQEDWANAENYLRQAATQVAVSEPNVPDILYYMGEIYRLQDEPDRALEIYNAAIEKWPDFAPLYLGRARVRLAQGSEPMQEAAAADLQTAIEKDPQFGEAYLTLAALQTGAGQALGALATLDRAQTVLPDSPLVYLYRAQVYLALEDSQQALENARRANALDMTLLLPYRIIGEARLAEGDLEGALSALITYLQFEQEDAQAWFSLANAHLAGDDPREALLALDRALRLDNRQVSAYLQRARIYIGMGSSEQALDDYQAAARLDPESYEASLGIGQALMALDYPGDAWDRFERTRPLAQTDRQKAELIFWRGQSLDALGEREAAVRDYRALVELPAGQAEAGWVLYAQDRLLSLVTSTPTQRPKTATWTPSPTFTRQPTRTLAPTHTRQPTRTATPTPKP